MSVLNAGLRRLIWWPLIFLLRSYVLSERISYDVVSWTSPRANLLGDGIYINSGSMLVGNGSVSMSYLPPGSSPIWSLDLKTPFTMSRDLSILELLLTVDVGSNPMSYVDGALFANYNGLVTFG